MNIDELRNATTRLNASTIQTIPADQVKISDRRMNFGDGLRFGLNAPLFQTVASALPVPADYFRRLGSNRALIVPHIEYWIGELGDSPLTVVSEGNKLVAVAAGESAAVTPEPVIAALAGLDVPFVDFQTFELDATAWRFAAMTERQRDVRVGDTVRMGIEIAGSLTGARALTVSLFSFRLICSNGAIHRSGRGSFRRNIGGGDGLDAWIGEAVGALTGDPAAHALDEIQAMTDVPVDPETVASIDTTFRSLRFPLRRDVMRRIEQEPPETAYDLWNHITYVATHQDAGRSIFGAFRRRRKMQTIAGALAGTLTTCESCYQITIAHADLDDGEADDATPTIEGTAVTVS